MYLKKFLDNKTINITNLSNKLNVSRQTIYCWNEKGVIPSKYEDAISNIVETFNSSSCIECKIEFYISYHGVSSGYFILDSDNIVTLEKDKLIVVNLDEYCERKYVVISEDNYSVKYLDGYCEFNDIEQLKLNIVRYETQVDYNNEKIKYVLYCSSNKKRNKIMSSMINNKYCAMKKRLELNIDENTNFKDVINYVKFNELDMVLLVKKEEMKIIHNELSHNKNNNDSNETINLLGMFLRYDDSMYAFLISVLGEKIKHNIENLNRFYSYLNIIFICMDNINSTIDFLRINHFDILNDLSLTVRDDSLLIDSEHLLRKVFAHECGHLIFSYDNSCITDRVYEERRANYFVSFIYDGKYDYFNLFFTELQSYQYHNPLVKADIEEIYNIIFKRGNLSVSLNKIFNDYNKEVDKLYGK